MEKILSDKKIYISVIVLTLVLLSVLFSFLFISSTQDAVVSADIVEISPKISSKIITLNTADKFKVKKGEILLQLESSNIQTELDNAKAKLEKVQNEFKISKNDSDKINFRLTQLSEEMKAAQAKLDSANNDYVLYKNAYKDGSVTKKDLNNATKNLEIARANYKKAQENLKNANANSSDLTSKKTFQNKEITELTSRIEQLEIDLSNATIISPIDGTVSRIEAKANDEVLKDETVISIIPNDFYIIANFKKASFLKFKNNIKKGQKAVIKVNSKTYKGIVKNIEDESVDIICVKILFKTDISKDSLVIGMPAKVKIKRLSGMNFVFMP